MRKQRFFRGGIESGCPCGARRSLSCLGGRRFQLFTNGQRQKSQKVDIRCNPKGIYFKFRSIKSAFGLDGDTNRDDSRCADARHARQPRP